MSARPLPSSAHRPRVIRSRPTSRGSGTSMRPSLTTPASLGRPLTLLPRTQCSEAASGTREAATRAVIFSISTISPWTSSGGYLWVTPTAAREVASPTRRRMPPRALLALRTHWRRLPRQVGGRGLFKAFDGTQFGTQSGVIEGHGKLWFGDPASGIQGDPGCKTNN